MRQLVFGIFVLIFLAIVAAILVFIATVVLRFGLSFAYAFVVESVPRMLAVLRADPWYIPALIIAVLLVWSYPWELEGGEFNPVRRGRQITSRRPALSRLPRRAATRTSSQPRVTRTVSRVPASRHAVRTRVGRSGALSQRRK